MDTYEIQTRELPETPTAVMRATLAVAEIGPWLGSVLGRVAGVLGAEGAGPAGPPFARYRMRGDGRFDVEAGFPAARAVQDGNEVVASRLPAGPVACTLHLGPYDEMTPAYAALEAWIRDHGYEAGGDPWEVYLSDPQAQPDPATWRTEVYAPYRR